MDDVAMAWTSEDYLRLGDQLRAARRNMGYKQLKQFQDYLDGPDSDGELTGRTYADIEGGKLRQRKNFAPESLAYLEDLFGWYPGVTRAILDGRQVDLYTGAETQLAGTWFGVEAPSVSQGEQAAAEYEQWSVADARLSELESRVAALEDRVMQVRAPKLPRSIVAVPNGQDLSDPDESLPEAAEEGDIEEPGEFND